MATFNERLLNSIFRFNKCNPATNKKRTYVVRLDIDDNGNIYFQHLLQYKYNDEAGIFEYIKNEDRTLITDFEDETLGHHQTQTIRYNVNGVETYSTDITECSIDFVEGEVIVVRNNGLRVGHIDYLHLIFLRFVMRGADGKWGYCVSIISFNIATTLMKIVYFSMFTRPAKARGSR